jgi:hypothetical protein
VRLRHGRSSLRQQQRVNPLDDATGEPRLVLTDRFDDHRPQITVAQHDQSMLVKPPTGKLQQPLPIARARQFTAQYPHQRTPLSDTQRTWVGLYKTRGGKVISEIVRDDGRARNVVADLGERFRSVKVFDSVESALASIRSASLRNQLLSDLGLLETKFID